MTETWYQEDLLRLISNFNAAVNNIRLYSAEHPQAKRYMERAYSVLTELFRVKGEIKVFAVDNDLVIDGRPVRSGGFYVVDQFVDILRENCVEGITLTSPMSEEEFYDFLKNFASLDKGTLGSTESIKIGNVNIKIKGEAGDFSQAFSEELRKELGDLIDLRDAKYEEVKEMYENVKRRQKINLNSMEDMIRAFASGFAKGLNPISLLASIKSADEYTFTHVINVCILTMGQAESLGFKEKDLYHVGMASIFHDVGKLFIPEEIIAKPEALNEKERKIVQSHTVEGARYILGMKDFSKLSVLGAFEHHIRYDGTGYPVIKGGWEPNIVSQMIAIADAFDAMRSRRHYKEPKPMETILKILREEKGTAFNPLLVNNFIKILK